ncbi:MAG: MFS transporter [Proteobacteria bacterium]|nr:MFS transporter [Pseudomonadota bacterium]
MLLGFGLAVTILNLDLTIVNLALPAIGSVFHIGLTHLQWINNSFVLAMTCVTLLSGHYADQYGRKKIYLIGIFVFTLGSLLASFAVNTSMIVSGRTLQGLGIGISFPLSLILIGESFPEYQRGTAMGLLSTFAGVSQAIGPTLGGFIVEWLGWRWAFIINLPICPIVILIVWWKCRAGLKTAESKYPLHLLSVFLLMAGLIAILTALNQIHDWGLGSVLFLGTFGIGILLLVSMLILQKRITYPFIDLTIFNNPAFAAINIIRPIFQFVFFGFYFILPLYLQNFLSYTPTQTGLIILMMTIMMGILSPLVGRFIDRIGPRLPLQISNSCMVLSFLIFIFISIHLNFVLLAAGLVLLGIATGIMFPTSNFTAVHSVSLEKKGIGMGVYSTTGGVMSSMGIAISGAVLSFVSTADFHRLVLKNNLVATASQFPNLNDMVNGAQPLHLPSSLLPLAQHAFLLSLHSIMMLYVLLAVIALFCCRYIFTKSPAKESGHIAMIE